MDDTAGTAVHLALETYRRQGGPHLSECQEQSEDAEFLLGKGSREQQVAQGIAGAAETENDCGSESG